MKYFLTHGNFNWADEIDLNGFDLWTEDQLNKARQDFSEGGQFYHKSVNVYVGSNEDQDIASSDVLRELQWPREITEEQYNAIESVFGTSYGKTYFNEYINQICDEEENG